MPTIQIAIDGPAGAGKSTLARRLAEHFHFLYVDTGALYRAVGLYALRRGADPKDAARVVPLLAGIALELRYENGVQKVYLNREDVSEPIRAPEVSMAASGVSAIPEVRQFLLELQKEIAGRQNVVMDGRDIGTVVLPQARIKLFLTASPEDRARRRYEELAARGGTMSYEEVLADVVRRDRQDENRAIAPLKPARDAVIVDTTGYELERSFAKLTAIVGELLP